MITAWIDWGEFFDSWELFGASYGTGLLVAAMLGICGVFVVAQRQVFVGVAIAQASALGIATALIVTGAAAVSLHHDHHGLPIAFGIAFAIAASLATARGLRGEATADTIGAWIFLIGSSGTVLLLANSPHGLEQVERLTFSSMIGADEHDLLLFGLLLLVTVAITLLRRSELLLISTDPETARALGRPTRRWQIGTAAWIGLAIGTAMHATGTLYAFGCLALPALAAKEFCRSMRGMLWASPAIALGTAMAGILLAHASDLPTGQVTVGIQCLLLLLARGLRAARPR